MRIEGWRPDVFFEVANEVLPERLLEAAEYVAAEARRRAPVGKISHPMYRRGPYAGQVWTSRDGGRMKKSIRVVQKRGKTGQVLWAAKNIRVYVGHYMAWYASIVEHYTPFMRPTFYATIERVKAILGAK